MTFVNADKLTSATVEDFTTVEDSTEPRHLLIVSYCDEGKALSEILVSHHFTTTFTEVTKHAQEVIHRARPASILICLDRGTIGQLRLIKLAAEHQAKVVVVGPADTESFARQCLSQGADHYLASPVTAERLWSALGLGEVVCEGKEEAMDYSGKEGVKYECGMLFSRSSNMQRVADQVKRVAPTSATVFLTGESGTGKEVVAQAIRQHSSRRHKPFVPVNCGAISPQLIESELFGHAKGSFTGAVREHIGVFERASGGTLFLDEITEMPIELQVKLLRVLETRRFVRVGGDREQEADVRIIAATNRCPETEVKEGNFRADLLYRLQVFPVWLPPLREREGDVRLLAEHFLAQFNEADGSAKRFSEDALAVLESYPWPGNLRELKNVIQRAHIMADSLITVEEVPEEIVRPTSPAVQRGPSLMVTIGSSVAEVERSLIFATLEECGGKKEMAANILGVSMKTLYNRLRQYGSQKEV